ncbi:unnamed protein product [Protopolystoma xenopodis]|uniref:Uncharacterized protein n=1 Tax=Protopolystoma xenopodis TaxID=117903 RepID=A0A448WS59_9PLAT|nr:unnamed protein product [Protopolystoma xenopodis]
MQECATSEAQKRKRLAYLGPVPAIRSTLALTMATAVMA